MNCESRDRTTIECNLALCSCGIRTDYVRFSAIASKFKLFRHKAKWHKRWHGSACIRALLTQVSHIRIRVAAHGINKK